jgi:hypothetical protein
MCSAAARLLGVAAAAIVVMAEGVPGATFASHSLAQFLEDLQFTLGAGPRVDAWTQGVPITALDLGTAPVMRWAGFGTAAVDAGARSVHSFPLRVGAARLGVLTLYRHEPGPLAPDVYADALIVADVVTNALLTGDVTHALGGLDARLSDEELNAEVHQASGMVSVQLGVSVGEALARLRARAFVDGTTLAVVARKVVARSLRLDEP